MTTKTMATMATTEQRKTLLAATLIGPTAKLTTEEALRRVEELRQRSHVTMTRRYKADHERRMDTRTNVPVADKRHRRPEFVAFARDWVRYMAREGGSTID